MIPWYKKLLQSCPNPLLRVENQDSRKSCKIGSSPKKYTLVLKASVKLPKRPLWTENQDSSEGCKTQNFAKYKFFSSPS